MAAKIRVLIVDDSALIRSVMREIVDSQPDMEVIGVAPDPLVAREMIRERNPDVLTLDVEMPKMDGLDFLERLMRLRPMPVVMVSSLTERGSETTLRALELGAVDFVAKPKMSIQSGIAEELAAQLQQVHDAGKTDVHGGRPRQLRVEPDAQALASRGLDLASLVGAIGASTGGTQAIEVLLQQMPADIPGMVVVQHMPEGFTRSFAQRLDSLCRISVKEAVDGDRVLPGHAYLAPGHSHLMLVRSGANYVTRLDQGPPVNRHRPSVDVLFESAAVNAGKNALGVILTGMGKDGAAGMLKMREAGAVNFAQDEATCVVYGMPREAVAVGAVHEVAPLAQLPGKVLGQLASDGGRALRV